MALETVLINLTLRTAASMTSNTNDSNDDDSSQANIDHLIIAFIFVSLVIFICCLSPFEAIARFIGRYFCNGIDDHGHVYVVDSEAFEKAVIMKQVSPHEVAHSFPVTCGHGRRNVCCKRAKQRNPFSQRDAPFDDSNREDEKDEVGKLFCRICLEPLQVGETIALPKTPQCCHYCFHSQCISAWILRHNSCPICRSVFIKSSDKCVGSTTNYVTGERLNHNEYLARLQVSQFCEEHGLIWPPST